MTAFGIAPAVDDNAVAAASAITDLVKVLSDPKAAADTIKQLREATVAANAAKKEADAAFAKVEAASRQTDMMQKQAEAQILVNKQESERLANLAAELIARRDALSHAESVVSAQRNDVNIARARLNEQMNDWDTQRRVESDRLALAIKQAVDREQEAASRLAKLQAAMS